MFLQAGSRIDVGSASLAPTLNCSFLIPHSTCGTSALIDCNEDFCKKQGQGRMALPQFSWSVYNCC
jgi:hypothetical protein